MKKRLLLQLVVGSFAAASLEALTIDTVVVGNPGNPNDPLTGKGRVAYEYHIGTYEVTNIQYTAFLNAADPLGTNPNGIYNGGNIQYDAGATAGSKYTVEAGFESKPVNNASYWDALRFCNWLTSGDTETGVYFLTPDGIANNSITRDPTAWAAGGVAMANGNEWYKAAYHQPAADGGDYDNYWLYPTASNSISTDDANYDNSVGTLTDVGSYSATSYYGTFDQGGNAAEWVETPQIIEGGSFDREDIPLSSLDAWVSPLSIGSGFRVTSPQAIVDAFVWGKFDILDISGGFWVDTGSWLRVLETSNSPWVWSAILNDWVYIPQQSADAGEGWVYIPNTEM